MNTHQFRALNAIYTNNPHYVEDLADEKGIDKQIAMGILSFVATELNNYLDLSPKQQFYFKEIILPLVENVECQGMIEGVCQGNGYISDEDLENAYNHEDFECSICSGTRENWFSNNP
ncbi:MarR family transcriptional regulator [Acinetobacter baumannii]|uniref:MarR family transcriptional regulator n=1 Tax=Acinetobacter baumannii TaxID=470 RepID=UPI000BF4DC64|nr:helix-turn-helix domain-containing protein [Acinetobacter baumannii]MDC5450742.1 hypothetical protein [Acinetobacter baumannii]MDC5627236.1 hypothetical protein [Acinetobacter baumannii]MDV7468056.1 helix-turn-helix domain-containing protein [Acinetobacter baumannii]